MTKRSQASGSWLEIQSALAGASAPSARLILALEEALPLPRGVAEALTSAGLDVVRTNSGERAGLIARSILLDGLVVTVADGVDDGSAVEPWLDITSPSGRSLTCPIVIIAQESVTPPTTLSTGRVVVVQADTLTRRDAREHVVRHLTGIGPERL